VDPLLTRTIRKELKEAFRVTENFTAQDVTLKKFFEQKVAFRHKVTLFTYYHLHFTSVFVSNTLEMLMDYH